MNQVLELQLQIARLRKQKGATQEELAQHLGVSYQAVSKWETGAAYPDITLLPAIAQYFGESVDTILGIRPLAQKPEAVYEFLKQLLGSVSKEELYPLARNLSGILFEGIATKGWKGYVPWEIRNRLLDNGYSNWGFAADIEPEGFSAMIGGLTIIADMKEVHFPQKEHIVMMADIFGDLSDVRLLGILTTWISHYKGNEKNSLMTLNQICELNNLDVPMAESCMSKLLANNWVIKAYSPETQELQFQLMLGRLIMPLLLLAKTFTCDLKPH
jgi:transcriptional regulator with XRE-family HTH domain